MTSRAGQLIASPTWGPGRRGREAGAFPRAVVPVRFRPGASSLVDAAGAVLVLGATAALWAAFLAAVW